MSARKWILAGLLIGSGLVTSAAHAETIAIIGTGNVGAALGQRFAEAGHTVIYGSRDPARASVQSLVAATGNGATAAEQDAAAQAARVVVLAVPFEIVESLTRELGDLSGRIVIDPTNPRRIAEDGLRDYAFADSNAERIQAVAPDAFVVKAFSTLGAETMLDPARANGPVSIPLAGDDAEAKRVVAGLVSDIGLVPVDVGPLRYAHVIEGLHYLRTNAGVFGDARINFYFPPDPP
jgi:NADPH-dependent F420 reductase